MKPIDDIFRYHDGVIRGVMFDIDDTFTLNGRIRGETFSELLRLYEH